MTRTIVDGHAHVWNRSRTPIDWIDESLPEIDRDFSVDQLEGAERAAAERHGVGYGGAVLVQALNDAGETRDLLRTARGAVVGWVDLEADGDADDVAVRLAALRDGEGGHRLAGNRHLAHVDPDPGWLRRPGVARGLEALAEDGLVFDLVVRPWQLATAVETVDEHPALRFVLDHLGQPPADARDDAFTDWRRDLSELARRPTVVAKVSGVALRGERAEPGSRLDRVLTTALGAFGPERLMFGSDWPLVRLADDYPAWLGLYLGWTAQLSPPEQGAIDSATALYTYGDRS